MPLASGITSLAQRIGAEIKSLRAADANVVLDRPGGYQSPGVRRAAFSFGSGNNAVRTDYLDAFTRLPIRLPVATTRWRLRISNKDNTGTAGSAYNVQGVWIGDTFRNFDTGDLVSWTGTNTQVVSTPSGSQTAGAEWVSGWITTPAAQFVPNIMRSISIAFTRAAGNLMVGSGGSWISTVRADASVGVPGTAMTYVPWVPFTITVEYEFVGSNKIVAVVGDSISEGVGSTFHVNCWHQRASMRLGMPFVMSASSGAFAQASFTNSYGGGALTEPRWQRIRDADLNIDAAVVHLGTNETVWGGTLLGWQQGMVIVYNRIISEWGVRDVYATTLAPRDVGTAVAGEIMRKQMNDYLRTGKSFYREIFDISVEMEATPNGNTLRADYRGPNADVTHWGDIGQHRANLAIQLDDD